MKKTQIDPHEVERQVVLALVLEPLPEKEGCTTRSIDCDPALKLQYFQTCAVNVGKYFFKLAERVSEYEGQPPVFYDLALDAWKSSMKNIDSSKSINHGLIGLLMPLVLSSLLTEGDGKEVCKNMSTVLKNSSAEDARLDDLFYGSVFLTSKKETKQKYAAEAVGGENLYIHHERKGEVAKKHGYVGGVEWAKQLLTGLPLLQDMYDLANQHLLDGLLLATKKAYDFSLKQLPYHSPGFAADYAAATAYLLLRDAEAGAKIVK